MSERERWGGRRRKKRRVEREGTKRVIDRVVNSRCPWVNNGKKLFKWL